MTNQEQLKLFRGCIAAIQELRNVVVCQHQHANGEMYKRLELTDDIIIKLSEVTNSLAGGSKPDIEAIDLWD